jgi:hypothetical protein
MHAHAFFFLYKFEVVPKKTGIKTCGILCERQMLLTDQVLK